MYMPICFYAEMRNKNGERYDTSANKGVQSSIQRHLIGAPFQRNLNLVTNEGFIATNNMWEAETTILLEESGDTAGHHHSAITTEDLAKLSEKIEIDHPVGLRHQVFC